MNECSQQQREKATTMVRRSDSRRYNDNRWATCQRAMTFAKTNDRERVAIATTNVLSASASSDSKRASKRSRASESRCTQTC